jgi:hypothetical protein
LSRIGCHDFPAIRLNEVTRNYFTALAPITGEMGAVMTRLVANPQDKAAGRDRGKDARFHHACCAPLASRRAAGGAAAINVLPQRARVFDQPPAGAPGDTAADVQAQLKAAAGDAAVTLTPSCATGQPVEPAAAID